MPAATVDETAEHGLTRRALAVRRAIAEYAMTELLHRNVVTVEPRDGEWVVAPVG